jgi:hypothetical protein
MIRGVPIMIPAMPTMIQAVWTMIRAALTSLGEVASFVHGEEIEADIRAGSSSNCAKLGKQYVVRARKAIQGYFGLDSMQYA